MHHERWTARRVCVYALRVQCRGWPGTTSPFIPWESCVECHNFSKRRKVPLMWPNGPRNAAAGGVGLADGGVCRFYLVVCQSVLLPVKHSKVSSPWGPPARYQRHGMRIARNFPSSTTREVEEPRPWLGMGLERYRKLEGGGSSEEAREMSPSLCRGFRAGHVLQTV